MGLCCIPYALLQMRGLSAIGLWFMPDKLSALQGVAITRLFTPAFVHYTVLHLLTNVVLWWMFASQIEARSRCGLVLLAVLAAGVTNLLQWYVGGPKFGGLSGVVYALLGYLWLTNRCRGAQFQLDPLIGWGMLALIPLAATGWFGKFSNMAHVSGLVFGALVALAVCWWQSRPTATL